MDKKKNVLNFKPKKKVSRQEKKKNVLDEGKLGDLEYKIYSRGVIHIFDSDEKFLFKKDCVLFEETMNELNLNSLIEGNCRKITGSGDNDTLVFTCNNGDIIISLEKPEYEMISKLKEILLKGVLKKDKKGDK